MDRINEDKLEVYKIDFSSQISERYLKSFAHKVGEILKAMTTGRHAPVSVSGEADKVKAFAKALGREERYIMLWRNLGEAHQRLWASGTNWKQQLQNLKN